MARILCDAKLGEKQFIHPTNKNRKGGIALFNNSKDDNEKISFSKCYRRIYPDFYRENVVCGLQNGMILDAKYQGLEQGLVRDDLYQIISYMHTMQFTVGGFLYPYRCHKELGELNQQSYKLANNSGIIHVFGIPILQTEAYPHFKAKMRELEVNLLERLQ